MSYPHSTAPKPKCTPCLGFLLLGLVLLVVASGWVVKVVEKVFSGAGLEHCCTIEGVPFSYIAVFVLLCGIAAVLLLGVALQAGDWLVRRDFERKYGVKVPASTGEPTRYGGSDYGPSLHGYEHHDDDTHVAQHYGRADGLQAALAGFLRPSGSGRRSPATLGA